MNTPSIFNDNRGKVWVQLDGKAIRVWHYYDESMINETLAMLKAEAFVEGWEAREQMEKT